MSTPPELDFGDPLDGRAPDDSDLGWGEDDTGRSGQAEEGAEGEEGAEALRRFLAEKPPHHL